MPHNNPLAGRALGFIRRKAGQLFSRSVEAAPPPTLREFKERAWQSSKAAGRYLVDTETQSLGMRTELSVACAIARGKVLDVGAGTGRFSAALCHRGHAVTSIDISDEMLRLAKAKAGESLNCVRASAFTLPFADEAFDTVMSFWLLVHFKEWAQIVREMVRVTKPGGRILFEAQVPEIYHEARHLRPDTEFVARLETPAGFHAFQPHEEVLRATEGCRVAWTQPYDFFNDNFMAQAVLGKDYTTWLAEVKLLLNEESCALYWQWFEAAHGPRLPRTICRKQLYVIQKGTIVAAGDSTLPRVPPSVAITPEVNRLWSLFHRAFGPVCPELPTVVPSQS